MENSFKRFYEDWQDTVCAIKEARTSSEFYDAIEHQAFLEDDFDVNFQDYLQSAREEYCLKDFENLLTAYPELDTYGYVGSVDMDSHDDDF